MSSCTFNCLIMYLCIYIFFNLKFIIYLTQKIKKNNIWFTILILRRYFNSSESLEHPDALKHLPSDLQLICNDLKREEY